MGDDLRKTLVDKYYPVYVR